MASYGISLDDLKEMVAKKLSSLLGREARKYKVHGDGGSGLLVACGDCVVAIVQVMVSEINFLPTRTELGKKFAIELAAIDPTVWWKVIYYSEVDRKAVFCGDNEGKLTPQEALAELTPEVMNWTPRLVSFVNAGCIYNDQLRTLTFQMIGGTAQRPNVSEKVFEDQAFIFKYR